MRDEKEEKFLFSVERLKISAIAMVLLPKEDQVHPHVLFGVQKELSTMKVNEKHSLNQLEHTKSFSKSKGTANCNGKKFLEGTHR